MHVNRNSCQQSPCHLLDLLQIKLKRKAFRNVVTSLNCSLMTVSKIAVSELLNIISIRFPRVVFLSEELEEMVICLYFSISKISY